MSHFPWHRGEFKKTDKEAIKKCEKDIKDVEVKLGVIKKVRENYVDQYILAVPKYIKSIEEKKNTLQNELQRIADQLNNSRRIHGESNDKNIIKHHTMLDNELQNLQKSLIALEELNKQVPELNADVNVKKIHREFERLGVNEVINLLDEYLNTLKNKIVKDLGKVKIEGKQLSFNDLNEEFGNDSSRFVRKANLNRYRKTLPSDIIHAFDKLTIVEELKSCFVVDIKEIKTVDQMLGKFHETLNARICVDIPSYGDEKKSRDQFMHEARTAAAKVGMFFKLSNIGVQKKPGSELDKIKEKVNQIQAKIKSQLKVDLSQQTAAAPPPSAKPM